MTKNLKWSLVFVIIVLTLDQILKIWVKTNMLIGESSFVNWNWSLKWAQLLFVENNGMALGMELPGNSGKLILTTLRLVVISFIGVYIYKNSKKELPFAFILTLSAVFAGALGNLLDSLFYGMIFSDTPDIYSGIEPAKFVALGKGYAGFMQGKVVDMFYFPLFNIHFPDWFPFLGGQSRIFFEPVFNIADALISVGVVVLLIFGKKWFTKLQQIDDLAKVQKEEIQNLNNNGNL
jgi:signal peptidase II